jgi:hypothetical protein
MLWDVEVVRDLVIATARCFDDDDDVWGYDAIDIIAGTTCEELPTANEGGCERIVKSRADDLPDVDVAVTLSIAARTGRGDAGSTQGQIDGCRGSGIVGHVGRDWTNGATFFGGKSARLSELPMLFRSRAKENDGLSSNWIKLHASC